MAYTQVGVRYKNKSRATYVVVDPSVTADGVFVRVDNDGSKIALVRNGVLSVDNCGIFPDANPATNLSTLNAILALAQVDSIEINNPDGQDYPFSGTLTIPVGKTLRVSRGNRISGTCTVNTRIKSIEAGPYQIFADTVTLTSPDASWKTSNFLPEWIGATPIYDSGSWYYDPTDTTMADDGAMCLVKAGKRIKRRSGRVVCPEYFGAAGDGATNDSPAYNAMFLWMEDTPFLYNGGAFEIRFLNTNYYFHDQVNLPRTMTGGTGSWFKVSGTGVVISTDQPISMFYRIPPSDAVVGAYNSSYKMVWEGLLLQGNRATTNQVGMQIACFYGAQFRDMHFYGLDTAVLGYFMTKCTWTNCFFSVNLSKDLVLNSLQGYPGLDQNHAGTASNDCHVFDCRFYKWPDSISAIEVIGSDAPTIRKCVIEGSSPQYGIYFDFANSNNVNVITIDDIWFETVDSTGCNMRIIGSGTVKISNIQRIYPQTFMDIRDCQTYTNIYISNIVFGGNAPSENYFVAGTEGNPSYENVSIQVSECDAAFSAAVMNKDLWSQNTLPGNLVVYTNHYNAGFSIATTLSEISLLSRVGLPGVVNRALHLDSNVFFNTDNGGAIGGFALDNSRGAYNRPRALFVGTDGIQVDNVADFYWGRSSFDVSDLGLRRQQAAVLQVNSTGAMLLPEGTTAQRPAAPAEGMIRRNITLGWIEQYLGGTWSRFDSVSSAPTPAKFVTRVGTDGILFEGDTSYTNAAFIGYTVSMWRGGVLQEELLGQYSYNITTGATTFQPLADGELIRIEPKK